MSKSVDRLFVNEQNLIQRLRVAISAASNSWQQNLLKIKEFATLKYPYQDFFDLVGLVA